MPNRSLVNPCRLPLEVCTMQYLFGRGMSFCNCRLYCTSMTGGSRWHHVNFAGDGAIACPSRLPKRNFAPLSISVRGQAEPDPCVHSPRIPPQDITGVGNEPARWFSSVGATAASAARSRWQQPRKVPTWRSCTVKRPRTPTSRLRSSPLRVNALSPLPAMLADPSPARGRLNTLCRRG